MKEQLYILLLDNCSVPAFMSAEKPYIGTINDIDGFINVIKEDDCICEEFKELIPVYKKYLDGEKNVTHRVACRDVPFLAPLDIFDLQTKIIDETTSIHKNTWYCDYKIHFDKANTEHIWIFYNEKYYRCIRAKFTNLKYWNQFKSEYVDFDMFWGYPHQIERDGDKIYNRMFVIEKSFATKEGMMEDIKNFNDNPDVVFTEIINDIFGDG